jgi:hypothetical protein
MKKQNKHETYSTLEVVATVNAVLEFHEKLVLNINPTLNYNTDLGKYSEVQQIAIPGTEDTVLEAADSIFGEIKGPQKVAVCPVSHYVRFTVTGGTKEKWMHDEVCEVLVTDEHREKAETEITFLRQIAVMEMLQGKPPTGFGKVIFQALEQDTSFAKDCGLLCYIPNSYRMAKSKENTNLVKAGLQGSSKALGAPGTKIAPEMKIIVKRFLRDRGSYIYEGSDTEGNLYQFWRDENKVPQFDIGCTYKLTAKIKNCEVSDYSAGAMVNNINWVKVAK